jgi:DNA-binding NtrC family response regulator
VGEGLPLASMFVASGHRPTAVSSPCGRNLFEFSPGIDGIESTRQIRQRQPGVRVLLLSTHDRYDDAGTCGAVGYLPKRTLSPSRLRGVWAGQELIERTERRDSSE